MLSQEHPPVTGNSGGVEPATSAFTEPRARRYTTNCIDRAASAAPVIPGGLEPPISSASGRRRRRWATGSEVPQPGFEPGMPRSKRGVMVRFTTGASVSGRRGTRTLTAFRQTALAERPGEPVSGSLPFSVDPPGVEPGLPACHTGVFPFDHGPVVSGATGSCTLISRVRSERPPVGRRPQVVSDRGGSRTHTAQVLGLMALPVGLPGRESGTPDSNRAARFIRPGRAPARPQSCRPGS